MFIIIAQAIKGILRLDTFVKLHTKCAFYSACVCALGGISESPAKKIMVSCKLKPKQDADSRSGYRDMFGIGDITSKPDRK